MADMDNPHVLIVGAGKLGQALGACLRANGKNKIFFWDIDPTKVVNERPLHEAVSLADFVFLCLNSWDVRSALSDAAVGLAPRTVVVIFSKGVDAATGYTTGELLPKLLPKHQPFVVVGGPMLAAEIMAGQNASAVFASPDLLVAKKTADLFRSEVFAVEVSHDAMSVSLAGVLKNIYAVGLGVADGLELDGNAKGWLVARSVDEMLAITELLGADKKIILGTAGLADFVATAYSPHSRNRMVGNEIVKNGKCNLRGEGTISLPLLAARLGSRADRLPLFNAIKKIAIDCEPAKSIMDAYLAAP
jgi:glycerol-3-phosphate dehydrogenase (NAD(P)+)